MDLVIIAFAATIVLAIGIPIVMFFDSAKKAEEEDRKNGGKK